MPDHTDPPAAAARTRTVREVADRYVTALAELNPIVATRLGIRPNEDRLPDLSPAGNEASDALLRSTLAELAQTTPADDDDRRCARLLRERFGAELAMSEQGEHLRPISNLFGPPQRVRSTFLDMPAATADDWAVIASRMSKVPEALAGHRASLTEGISRGLIAGPRVVRTVIDQFGDWAAADDGRGWFAQFAAGATDAGANVPPPLRATLDAAAASATAAVTDLRDWMASEYLPHAAGQSDGVGPERYQVCARAWTGANLDLAQAYAWGWSQYSELREQVLEEAERIVPGASTRAAMDYLDVHGEAVDGVQEIRVRLQQMMDDAIERLDGTHFDIADPIKTVEARIAPPGSAAAPYYTAPSQDFARPGRTWLPTLGRTRFPLWGLVSTWYHEGVPGHHLQMAQWRYRSSRALDLPDQHRRGERLQRGLGPVRRAAHGRARLPDQAGRPARLPGRADGPRDPGRDRHRHAHRPGDPGRLTGRRGPDLDSRSGARVLPAAQRPA